MKKSTTKGYIINTLIIAAVFLSFALTKSAVSGNETFKLIIVPSLWQCCYLIILAASLNLVLGFLGQLSLGHCGFMAIGAYAAALISLACERAGVFASKSDPVFILVLLGCILAAGILAALVGLLVGIPALRLRGDYLAIITLGFGMIIVNIINNLPFAGQEGLSIGSASASLYKNGLGFGTASKVTFVWVAIITTVLCLIMMFMFIRSKYGRAIRAIRDDEIAASASGINTSYYKIFTFTYSAFFAGVAGALYTCANATLSTSSFAFTNGGILNSTFIVVMVVLGGMGSLTGSVVSAIIMFVVNYEIKNGVWVKSLPGFIGGIFAYPMLVYAIILIIVIMFRPNGIFGTYEFSPLNLSRDIKSHREKKALQKTGKKEAKTSE
ncbi:MAG: branched-chain amino acid ABC transporter permease [Clostridia bacterium]|nr:branched-chain amino acid ABC transporter permease [Clostridia bacterium]